MSKIQEVISCLESVAPAVYQESYDNSGLITGSVETEVTGVLICLDSTEEVIDEAIRRKCNLVIAHHPIVFSGLKKINGKNYVERTIIKAIKNDIAIYAIHTNLDNVYGGVNSMIAEKLKLINTKILAPKSNLLRKLVTFVPLEKAEEVRSALFTAGAGSIGNYDECSFNIEGEGTFRGNERSDPYVGKKEVRHTEDEIRLEMIFEAYREKRILMALFNAHPYEEIAYDIYSLTNDFQSVGSGLIGELAEPQSENDFLLYIKSAMKAGCIRHTKLRSRPVKKVAICGGSGSFLLNQAISSGADLFISADFKYHQFFDANGKIVIADIGHYESEQFTIELIKGLILKNFTTFALQLTEVNTNPVHYI
jgi:dinuclear metal center YbgI/SA1388 family protein